MPSESCLTPFIVSSTQSPYSVSAACRPGRAEGRQGLSCAPRVLNRHAA
jgi:hypothetical protein